MYLTWKRLGFLSLVLAGVTVSSAVLNGCNPKGGEETIPPVEVSEEKPENAALSPPEPVAPVQKVVELEPPKEVRPAEIPEVKMSDTVKATCKVVVGDSFPEILGLPATLGNKASIVFFFPSGSKPMQKMKNIEVLEDLQKLHAAHQGDLRVIAAGSGAKPDVAVDFDVVQDDGKAFEAVTTNAEPPRIFLLDSTGKILWMDTEYSNTTREQLHQAVEVQLKTVQPGSAFMPINGYTESQ